MHFYQKRLESFGVKREVYHSNVHLYSSIMVEEELGDVSHKEAHVMVALAKIEKKIN
jgi:hypothetical protein